MWFLNPAVQEFAPKCETFLKFIKQTIFLYIVRLVRHHYTFHLLPFLEHCFAHPTAGRSLRRRGCKFLLGIRSGLNNKNKKIFGFLMYSFTTFF